MYMYIKYFVDCVFGFFGENCEKICGMCKLGEICNIVIGLCLDGCESYFMFLYCKGSI